MKKLAILILCLIIFPFLGLTQSIENLDMVSPFHNGVAAIKRGNQWGFINLEGKLVIDFRSDIVPTITDKGTYPIFSEERCQILEVKNGISYFGYIDKFGKTVIKPQFLNAKNFIKGKALALELIKQEVTKNTALGKNVVYYRYFEVVIDKNGDILHYLNPSGVNITLDKDYLRKPPKITSKRLTNNLYIMEDKNKKFKIISTAD